MIIVVDFDGIIVEYKYLVIGRELLFVIEILKKLCDEYYRLILWIVCEGCLFDEVFVFCCDCGFEFYVVNCDYLEEEKGCNNYYLCKFKVDFFIDDCNLGGFFDWGIIYGMIYDGIIFLDLICNVGEFFVLENYGRGFFLCLFGR